MHLYDLIAALRAQGITLAAHGDRLRYYPKGALSPALLVLLRAHKDQLLALLTAPTMPADGWAHCHPCGMRFYGVAGHPRLCPACRKTRDGEPLWWWQRPAAGGQTNAGAG